jgi:hypothetical protein
MHVSENPKWYVSENPIVAWLKTRRFVSENPIARV